MVVGSSSVAAPSTSGFGPVSSEEFLDIQATIECGFSLKHVREWIRTQSHIHCRDKYSKHSSIIRTVWLNS